MALDPRELLKPFAREPRPEKPVPLAGTAAQKVQRLQIGVFGLVSMILVVALADIVVSQADETEASVVSDSAASVTSPEGPAPRDPLVDAGLVPEVQAEPEEAEVEPHLQEGGDVQLPSGVTAQ